MSAPALRFKDDAGKAFPVWEEKKLGEISTFFSGGTPLTTNKEFYVGEIPFIKSGEISKDKTAQFIGEAGLKNSSAKMVLKGDLLYALYGATSGEVAISKIEGAINQAVLCIRSKLNTYFLLSYFLREKEDILQTYLQGGQGNLSAEIVKSLLVPVPSQDEQTKIANFLTAVDEKIQQLNQKHDLLTQYKKGVMQQIFSQKLRFKDDDGLDFPEWEEATLGEVCDIKRGASPRPIADKKWFSHDSTIGWVRISDVSKSSKYLTKTEQYLSEAGIKKSRLVKKGNIIMSICATIGKPIYTNFDVCIHDGFVVFENLQIDHEYLYYYLMLIEKNWYQYGQPGSQVNLNSDIVSNETIPIPDIKEQNKIANFLTAIDDKVNATQSQLKAIKQYKQGLLQQMFV